MQINIHKPERTPRLPWRLLADKMSSSTLDVINFKRLLREAHRQQVAAMAVEATTMARKQQRKLQASDRKRAREWVLAETAHRSLDIRVFIHKFRVISVWKWCKYLNLIMNWVPVQDNVLQIGRGKAGRGRQAVWQQSSCDKWHILWLPALVGSHGNYLSRTSLRFARMQTFPFSCDPFICVSYKGFHIQGFPLLTHTHAHTHTLVALTLERVTAERCWSLSLPRQGYPPGRVLRSKETPHCMQQCASQAELCDPLLAASPPSSPAATVTTTTAAAATNTGTGQQLDFTPWCNLV